MTILLSGVSWKALAARDAQPGGGPLAPRPPTGARRASSTELVRELERLTEGLTFMSESDFPLDVVIWRRPGGGLPTAAGLARLTGEPHLETVRLTTVDDFFRAATQHPRASDPEERAIAGRFRRLADFLKDRLAGARAYRFGRSSVRGYVVGTAGNGDWIGIATTMIET